MALCGGLDQLVLPTIKKCGFSSMGETTDAFGRYSDQENILVDRGAPYSFTSANVRKHPLP